MAGRGRQNTCIHSGDLKSKVWGGGEPPEHLFQEGGRGEGGRERHLLPGPITHAGKIESDYQAEDLHTNIRAVGRAEMRARINIMSSNIW